MKAKFFTGVVFSVLALPAFAADPSDGVGVGGSANTTSNTPAETEKAVESFTKLDANADGAISMSEAKTAKTLTQKFKNADINKDGKIQEAEYVKFSMDE